MRRLDVAERRARLGRRHRLAHEHRTDDVEQIAGPRVWVDGRVVGGWAQRPDGVVAYRPLEDVGREAEASLEAAAASTQDVIGEARVKPRFPTPAASRALWVRLPERAGMTRSA